MESSVDRKSCFVISPIGGKGTDTRLRSNQVFDHIIEPIVSALGYEADRADKIAVPGMITDQIIEHLLNDDLVIADLTGRNANVFYELAIRHAIRKPVVIMISDDEDIPFDVSQSRAIQFNHRDLDSVAECKSELEKQINFLEEKPDQVFSPVSTAIDLQAMRESSDPSEQRDAHILSSIQALQADVHRLERRVDLSTHVPGPYGRVEMLPTSEEEQMSESSANSSVRAARRRAQRVRAEMAALERDRARLLEQLAEREVLEREAFERAERADRQRNQDGEINEQE